MAENDLRFVVVNLDGRYSNVDATYVSLVDPRRLGERIALKADEADEDGSDGVIRSWNIGALLDDVLLRMEKSATRGTEFERRCVIRDLSI